MNLFCDILAPMVWPLCFLLIALLILRQIKDEVKPIFSGMVKTLAIQSQRNALAWALGMMLGTVASLQAVVEVANQYHWLYIGAAAKILQPGLTAVIGFITKSPFTSPQGSTPPFNPEPPKS